MEWKLFDGEIAEVSTYEFHKDRPRAPHLEQPDHRARLLRVAELIREQNPESVSDLGCGDGGLLSLIKNDVRSWGYDWQPSNQLAWLTRGVSAFALDAFGEDSDLVLFGELTVMTEVLEHLTNPHEVLDWVSGNTKIVIGSSPWQETIKHHGDCHAWAWDCPGYRDLFSKDFEVVHHEVVDWSQIIVARSKHWQTGS